MKRYTPQAVETSGYSEPFAHAEMYEDREGEWVRWKDHRADVVYLESLIRRMADLCDTATRTANELTGGCRL